MKKLLTTLALAGLIFMTTSCSKDDDKPTPDKPTSEKPTPDKPTPDKPASKKATLSLSFEGLPNVGPDLVYEGWIIVDGKALTTGKFSVDDKGKLSKSTFELNKATVDKATKFVLTIEPAKDDPAAPSSTHILAGKMSDGKLSVEDGAALGTDFGDAKGKYILATPSSAATDDDRKGVWFIDPSSGSPKAGLNLPKLSGWQYEGWAIIDGKAVSTGKFDAVDKADLSGNKFAGTLTDKIPAFPGEDFITGTAKGFDPKTGEESDIDLSTISQISKIVVSVEPNPDNSPAPFDFKPLAGMDLDATSPAGGTNVHDLTATALIAPTGTGSVKDTKKDSKG